MSKLSLLELKNIINQSFISVYNINQKFNINMFGTERIYIKNDNNDLFFISILNDDIILNVQFEGNSKVKSYGRSISEIEFLMSIIEKYKKEKEYHEIINLKKYYVIVDKQKNNEYKIVSSLYEFNDFNSLNIEAYGFQDRDSAEKRLISAKRFFKETLKLDISLYVMEIDLSTNINIKNES